MLEFDHGKTLMGELWAAASVKVELPNSLKADYFLKPGPEPMYQDNRRAYHRYYMRDKAVLKRQGAILGAYSKDVSRQGIGFLSPVPLLPKERLKVRVAAAELNVEVTRCRRLEPNCFECGARFALQ